MLHCSEECTMIDIQDRAYCPVLEERRGIRRCAASDRNPAGFTPLLDREGKPVVTPYQK